MMVVYESAVDVELWRGLGGMILTHILSYDRGYVELSESTIYVVVLSVLSRRFLSSCRGAVFFRYPVVICTGTYISTSP